MVGGRDRSSRLELSLLTGVMHEDRLLVLTSN